MRVLLVGSGARETALAWKLSQSEKLSELHLAPGNSAAAHWGKPAQINQTSVDHITNFSVENHIDFVICGPEGPLAEGLCDRLQQEGIPSFGPTKELAKLESSKAFAKEVMEKAGIPTAEYQVSNSREQTLQLSLKMLEDHRGCVIKASGLASGKGVFVCKSADEIEAAVDRLYGSSMSEAADHVVVERILEGRECSYFTLIGPKQSLPVGFAVDFKRVGDGDQGPNTGGMGAYSPVPWLPDNATDLVDERIIQPLVKELGRRGLSYLGCLYVGLMWTKDGPFVVEFNVRLGDPEAQVLLPSFSEDLLEITYDLAVGSSIAHRRLTEQQPTVGVVMTSPKYPFETSPPSSELIAAELVDSTPYNQQLADKQVYVFGASMQKHQENYTPGNGRVLTVVAIAEDFSKARELAYERVALIGNQWKQNHHRKDIAEKVCLEAGKDIDLRPSSKTSRPNENEVEQ